MSEFVRATVGSGALTLAGRYYTDAAIYAAEAERIWGRQWLCVGRAEQLAKAGDFLVAEAGGESVIVARAGDGALHALFNVCRHRGARLCTERQGSFVGSIMCPYHAWTYGLDGRLLNARHMREVDGFDQRGYGLRRAALAEWEGFVLISLAEDPAPFERAWAPMIGKFSAWDLPRLRVVRQISYDVAANWKLIVQNYSECYHCPLVHPALERLSHSQSGRNDLAAGPFLGGYMTLNHPGGSMTTDGQTSRPPLGTLAGDDLDRVYYYSLFPNMLLSLHADYVMAHTLQPQGPGHTLVECSWLFDPAAMAQPGFSPDDAIDFWDMTNRQDWHVCELTQLGVASRAYTPGPYAHQEGLLAAFDQEYLRALGEG